ncbi:unnamed protein product [Cladocopium goreaui]|uniref:Monoglyceride lipase n=1 Tax=Cladocopium goreaui TaxID=2562237 RepID=A0A9P1FNT2_9DINO|nr:unnamed protein product [Cladocopium goreaui]
MQSNSACSPLDFVPWLFRPTQGNQPNLRHSGYFDILGQALKRAGYTAVAYDQVGCGYSQGDPGYIERYSFVVDDLQKRAEEHLRYPKRESQVPRVQCKLFILGESAGALLALRHGIGRSHFFPRLPLPGVDVVSTFDAAFGEPRWAAAGKADPIVRRVLDAKFHVRTGAETLNAVDFVNDPSKQRLLKSPLAIIVGEKEQRVDVGAIFEFYLAAGSIDKQLKVIPGACHQLFQDKADITRQAVQEVIAWLGAHS